MRTSSPRSLPPTEGACSTTSDPSRERPATTRSTSSSPTARKSVPSRSSRRITGRTPRRTRSAESTPHASAGGTSSTPRTWIGTAPSTASRPTCPRSYRERHGVYFVKSRWTLGAGAVLLDFLDQEESPLWRSTAGNNATESWICASNTNTAPLTSYCIR